LGQKKTQISFILILFGGVKRERDNENMFFKKSSGVNREEMLFNKNEKTAS